MSSVPPAGDPGYAGDSGDLDPGYAGGQYTTPPQPTPPPQSPPAEPVFSSPAPLPYNASDVQSKKLAAALTGILLGSLGVHKFILGYTNAGVVMLAVTLASTLLGSCLVFPLLGSIAIGVIGVVEGIIYLTKTDDDFYRTYMAGKKEWF